MFSKFSLWLFGALRLHAPALQGGSRITKLFPHKTCLPFHCVAISPKGAKGPVGKAAVPWHQPAPKSPDSSLFHGQGKTRQFYMGLILMKPLKMIKS